MAALCVSALLAVPLCAAQSAKSPLLVLLGGDAPLWQSACAERGWQFAAPWTDASPKSLDERIAALREVVERPGVDADRVYLAAQGNAAATLFYVASRMPDLWAAAAAIGGSPRAAIDSNRLFAANTANLPVLWLFAAAAEAPLGKKLAAAGYNLEYREAASAQPPEIFNWLAAHTRDPYPTHADCETGSSIFEHCYWIQLTRLDPDERNDVLDSTRVVPLGSNAVLALGSFGFSPTAPGPGVVVASLPEKYSGPLKLNDRIVELGGKTVKDAADFAATLYHTFEEKPVVVMVERGKEHLRMESKFVLPARVEMITARVRAQYLPDLQEIEVVSRAVTQMKLDLPAAWLPARISWNGTEVAKAAEAGCWQLDEQKELLTARRCAP